MEGADNPEHTGGSMFGNTAVAYTHSGGPMGHRGTNMAFCVAGVPSKLRMGEHIVRPSGHPGELVEVSLHGREHA